MAANSIDTSDKADLVFDSPITTYPSDTLIQVFDALDTANALLDVLCDSSSMQNKHHLKLLKVATIEVINARAVLRYSVEKNKGEGE